MPRLRPSPTAGLVLACLLVIGCGTIPNPLATPVPPDALHPNQPPPAVVPVNPAPADPVKVGELDRHRAIWTGSAIRDYSITLVYGCECALAGKPITVTVADGRVEGAVDDAGNVIEIDALTGFPVTVDALFEYADRYTDAGKIEFAWDEQHGFPTAIGIDPDLAARDDEVRIAVLELTPSR